MILGILSILGRWTSGEAVEPPVTQSPHGFEIGGKGRKKNAKVGEKRELREVSIKPIFQRILEERREISEEIAKSIVPAKKNARKKARQVEKEAVQAVLEGNDLKFFDLLEKWVSYKPVLPKPDVAGALTAYEAFAAQVALQVRQIQEQDDERAIMALIESGAI